MSSYEVVATGLAPMLMAANNEFIVKKSRAQKGGKTDEELSLEYLNEWRKRTYFNAAVGVYIPAENIEAMLTEAARKFKLGKEFTAGVIVNGDGEMSPVMVPNGNGLKPIKTLDEIEKNGWIDRRNVNGNPNAKKKVMVGRSRTRIPAGWQLTFTAFVDIDGFSRETFEKILEHAGARIGLCDWRPKYGRFEATIKEID